MAFKDTIDFYSSYVANWLSGGGLLRRNNLSSLGIKPLFDKIVTKKYVKRVVCITQFPVDYNERLSEVLGAITFTIDKSSKVFLNIGSFETKIDIMSESFRRQMGSAEDKYNKLKNVYEELSGTDKSTGRTFGTMLSGKFTVSKESVRKFKEDYESHEYISNVVGNSGKLFESFIFIELLSETDKVMLSIRREVLQYLDNKGFRYKELSANSANFLMNHSPSSFLKERKSKEFQEVLMSDENLASLTPYKTHGFIGDGTGTLLGIDTGSKTPFILNFFATGARQILLVNAPAGHGKTILTFGMILSLCAGNKHCSALDVKGGEYGKLSKFVKTLIIDISETSKSYVNTMRLDDVEVDTVDDCVDFYNMAFNATEGLLLMSCKPANDKEIRDMSYVLKMAITKLFSSRKVDKRSPKSLRNTKNIRYEDIIPILDELKNSASYSKYSATIDDMKVSIETKFRIEDTFKGREITIQDIIETPLVIYELNRNNPSSVSEDDAMRTQMISYLDMKKISIRKKMREGTVCIYEELARIEEFKAMLKFITAIVTGARSSNVMVILLMNTISVLDMPGMEPLKSNLSTLIIGPLESESDYKVLKSINGHRLEPMVKKIQSNKTQFRNYFAVQYDTGIDEGVCMMKAFIPEHILEDLETRDRMI